MQLIMKVKEMQAQRVVKDQNERRKEAKEEKKPF